MPRIQSTFLIAMFIVVASLSAPAFAEVQWQTDLDAGINMARGNNKLVFLEVSAPWCPACRTLDKLMHDKRIGQFLDPHFVSVKLDADSPQGQGVMRKYGAKGIPALFVFSAQGNFKGKMSGAPQDFDGFKHFVTNLAGGEAVLSAAGSPSNGRWSGGTASGAPPNFQNGNFGQGQPPYQQPYQQQQAPYPQGQPQGNYFQPQYQQQPMTGYAQPQYQQVSPPANYGQLQFPQGPPPNFSQVQYQPHAQPQYGAQPGYPPPQQQGQAYYPATYQSTGQPGAFSNPSYPAGQTNGYAPNPSGQMQNSYPPGIFPAGTGTQPGFTQGFQQMSPAYQPPQNNQAP